MPHQSENSEANRGMKADKSTDSSINIPMSGDAKASITNKGQSGGDKNDRELLGAKKLPSPIK